MLPINWWAVLVCGVVSMVVGFLWYGPLFGKTWMRLMGISEEDAKAFRSRPDLKRQMNINYTLTFAGSLVMAYVLAHSLLFANAYLQTSGWATGLQAALWNWLGFIAPVTLGSVLWEKKPWTLWILNNAYWLVLLAAMGVILAAWPA